MAIFPLSEVVCREYLSGSTKREPTPMTFQPGQSGNPAGRAAGSRNKKTLAAEAALFEHAQELVDDLVARARRGEPAAMRLALERVLPAGAGPRAAGGGA